MQATVLVVDDSVVIRTVLRDHLEAEGYEVREADSGEGALASISQDPPDTVLLDIEMPGFSGHEVLARLKAMPEVRDIPVVFLTGRTRSEEIVAALRAGAQDYLKKPFEPAELSARVGAAVRTKHLQDELRRQSAQFDHLSRTDALTGAFNRRHMEDVLRRLGSLASRHDQDNAVALFDIDHFKAVNDSFGHAAGDEVLREFTRRLGRWARVEDVLGRWGGEEFLLILHQTSERGAWEVAERVREVVAGAPFEFGGDWIDVTVSGGCAGGRGGDLTQLVHLADAALYRAKAAGRNRILAAESQQQPGASAASVYDYPR